MAFTSTFLGQTKVVMTKLDKKMSEWLLICIINCFLNKQFDYTVQNGYRLQFCKSDSSQFLCACTDQC